MQLPKRLDQLQTFLCHGHDIESLIAVKNYLQNGLGMPEPIILVEKPDSGLTIIEKFERYARVAHAAIALLTPDDIGAALSERFDLRARQNAIGELFWFLSWFGRRSGRVIVLQKGPLSTPSDLNGLTRIDLGRGMAAALLALTQELRAIVRNS